MGNNDIDLQKAAKIKQLQDELEELGESERNDYKIRAIQAELANLRGQHEKMKEALQRPSERRR